MNGPWLAKFGEYLGGWPADYLVLDVETNGYLGDPETVPTELGFTLVQGSQPAHCDAIVLDWSRLIDSVSFWARVDTTDYKMGQKGLRYATPRDIIKERGVDPREVFPEYRRMISDAVDAGWPIVGHNIYCFDRPLLERVCGRHFGGLYIPPFSVLDTGLIQVALGLGWDVPAGHVSRESFYDFARRFQGTTRWSLYDYCVDLYGLEVDRKQVHTAGYDTHVNHLFLEALKALAAAPVPG